MARFEQKILYIDLPSGDSSAEELSPSLITRFLGGRGLNSKLLFDHCPAGTDPLGPDNPLIIGAGLLTGTAVPAFSRFTVSAKSPLTGGLGDANSGGFFGPEMRFAGIQHLVIRGQAEKPVYLLIEDEHVTLRDAGSFWGQTVRESDAAIKRELGTDEVQILLIGPAGENLSPIAGVINNLSRAAARGGVAAVMGSKRIKAIVIKGSKGSFVSDKDTAFSLFKEIRESLAPDPWFEMF